MMAQHCAIDIQRMENLTFVWEGKLNAKCKVSSAFLGWGGLWLGDDDCYSGGAFNG